MEVVVSAEDDAEVRRISIANIGSQRPRDRRHLLRRNRAGAAGRRHRASGILEAVRRDRISGRARRDPGDATTAIVGTSRRSGPRILRSSKASHRQSRSTKPTGRGSSAAAGSVRTAIAVMDGRPLSNTVGTVLDPIFALAPPRTDRARRRRRASRSGPLSHPPASDCSTSSTSIATRLPSSARRRSPGPRRRCSSTTSGSRQVEASVFQRLAGHLLYANSSSEAALRHHPPRRGRAIRPLAARHFRRPADRALAHRWTSRTSTLRTNCCSAHEYWQMKLLAVDLVIVNERASSYVQDLQIGLETLVRQQPDPCRKPAWTDRGAASSSCEPT